MANTSGRTVRVAVNGYGVIGKRVADAVNGAAESEKVRPIRKVRTSHERYDPAGGGINVARVVKELGGAAFAIYLPGGTTGPLLDALVRNAGIPSSSITIKGHTRISHTVHERSSGLEFRFVPEGPEVIAAEWQACLSALDESECEYLVASGSLPRGVPDDFYAQVAALAARKGAKLVLDTSGAALREASGHGLYLIKPSLGELQDLLGRTLADSAEQDAALQELIGDGAAKMIALTLGRDGAVLATRQGIRRLQAVKVIPKSAVGAGDSFLAAMTLALSQGRDPEDAFVFGSAVGTAAVLTMAPSFAVGTMLRGYTRRL
jgi:6-phosphofructokinase 2